MSVFNGLLAIREFLTHHPNVPIDEIVVTLTRLSPNDAYHDYEKALHLHESVAIDLDFSHPQMFFREVLTLLILQQRPWWLRFAVSGRQKLVAVLTVNEHQCFEAAGLLEQPAGADTLAWWDKIAAYVRSDQDAARLTRGREAERLTIEYETARLNALGIPEVPRWVAVEDNTVGYDVLSYDRGSVGPVAKLIEVKSSRSQPAEIFLTRKEWETALDREPNYRFHIWLFPGEELLELTPAELAPHVPENRGMGLWEISRIVLATTKKGN